jgi:hypothetical protein
LNGKSRYHGANTPSALTSYRLAGDIAGPHLGQYAGEMAWREDMRRKATGTQFNA